MTDHEVFLQSLFNDGMTAFFVVAAVFAYAAGAGMTVAILGLFR